MISATRYHLPGEAHPRLQVPIVYHQLGSDIGARQAYLGHSVALNRLARETDLEDLVDLGSKRRSTG